ncbi:MAG: phosphoribosylanthranilate isomerase [Candidatus Saganbacteria bacterium]|nr:phosphoribosylanthranilate isomerase [Candidatus Saganbacteria bacterium]
MTKVKICGITNLKDALDAAALGADALGFVFAKSPRKISPEKAKEIVLKLPWRIIRVGVFVNEGAERVNRTVRACGLDLVQLHGDETPSYCKKIRSRMIKAVRIKNEKDLLKIKKYKVSAILLDAYSKDKYGGTGKTFDWSLAKKAKKYGIPVILSGGLDEKNLSPAIKTVRPYAVDISSGVEILPGRKSAKKMKTVIAIAKGGCII